MTLNDQRCLRAARTHLRGALRESLVTVELIDGAPFS